MPYVKLHIQAHASTTNFFIQLRFKSSNSLAISLAHWSIWLRSEPRGETTIQFYYWYIIAYPLSAPTSATACRKRSSAPANKRSRSAIRSASSALGGNYYTIIGWSTLVKLMCGEVLKKQEYKTVYG
jgi:hypothetical protein